MIYIVDIYFDIEEKKGGDKRYKIGWNFKWEVGVIGMWFFDWFLFFIIIIYIFVLFFEF